MQTSATPSFVGSRIHFPHIIRTRVPPSFRTQSGIWARLSRHSGLDPESGLVYPVIPDPLRNLGFRKADPENKFRMTGWGRSGCRGGVVRSAGVGSFGVPGWGRSGCRGRSCWMMGFAMTALVVSDERSGISQSAAGTCPSGDIAIGCRSTMWLLGGPDVETCPSISTSVRPASTAFCETLLSNGLNIRMQFFIASASTRFCET